MPDRRVARPRSIVVEIPRMSQPLARIAFAAHSEWRFFLLALARELAQRHGAELHLYCMSEQERTFYEGIGAREIFATIANVRGMLDTALEPVADPDAAVAEARRNEERLGVTINTLVATNRHLGRGFSLGGFRHPRSRYSERTDATGMLAAFNRRLAFWEREFTEKGITLLVNGEAEAQRVARLHGIPCRSVIGSRYRNYHYWCWNEFFEAPPIEAAYHRIAEAPRREIAAPYDAHMQYREAFLKTMGLGRTLYDMAYKVAQHLYWRLRRYDKAKGYYMSSEVAFYWRRWRANRDMTGRRVVRLAEMKDRPFVFFPLHAEPESSLQQASPEYFFQLGAIASIARDLPAGYTLAVKETYQTQGRRPADFYDQIREFKNVVILDMLELGLEAAQRAEAVVTITGTAGLEAAVLGKPVVTFGRHNFYNVLPHVTVIEREDDLAPALRRALIDGIDTEAAKADAARLLQAVIDNSFDMRGYDYRRIEEFDPAIVGDAIERLVESLETGMTQPATARAG